MKRLFSLIALMMALFTTLATNQMAQAAIDVGMASETPQEVQQVLQIAFDDGPDTPPPDGPPEDIPMPDDEDIPE